MVVTCVATTTSYMSRLLKETIENSIFEKKQSTDFCQSIIETSNFVIRGIGLAAGYGLLQGQGLSRTPIDKPILNTN